MNTPAQAGDALAHARAAAPLIAAAADRIEAGACLPPDVLDALHAARLFRTLLPRELGGEELHPALYAQMIETIAAADASTAWCLGQGSGCSMAAAYLPGHAAAAVWGDDPRAVLAWGAGPQGMARVVEGGYRLTGTWSFASGIRHATWLGGHCRIEEPDGSLRRDVGGELAERSLLFPKHLADITENWNVIGLRGTGSDTYAVTDLFVADDFSLCRDAETERRHPGTLYCFSTTAIYASSFASVALGIAGAALEEFRAIAKDKTPRAETRRLRENPVVQRDIAVAEAELGSARLFLHQTLRDVWDSVAVSGRMTTDEWMKIRLAGTFATRQARGVVDMAYHAAGANAIFAAGPFERRFRDIHTVSQQVQARATHFETVGAHLLGLAPPKRFI